MICNLTNRFILLLDVETANTLEDAFVYNIGFCLMDIYGNIYEWGSFVIRDIFVNERELMKQCYYHEKMPEYVEEIHKGQSMMIDFMEARNYILRMMKQYNCTTVAAYNCNFDRNALNTTLRYLTKSQYRWFFPYGTEFICIWNMACNSICQTSEYKTFAETNRYYSNFGKNYRCTAENVYAFITNDPSFNEEHKGVDDVKIEQKIFVECIKHNTEIMGIKRNCWMNVKRGALMLRVIFMLSRRASMLNLY